MCTLCTVYGTNDIGQSHIRWLYLHLTLGAIGELDVVWQIVCGSEMAGNLLKHPFA